MARKILVDTDELFGDVKLWRLMGDRGVFFYERLWGLAERWGGFNPDVEKIAIETLALRCDADEALGYLRKLHEADKIAFYHQDEKKVGYIRAYKTWNDGLQHPPRPVLPLPDGITYDGTKRKYTWDTGKLNAFLKRHEVDFSAVCTMADKV